jgi:hypothetical protein
MTTIVRAQVAHMRLAREESIAEVRVAIAEVREAGRAAFARPET